MINSFYTDFFTKNKIVQVDYLEDGLIGFRFLFEDGRQMDVPMSPSVEADGLLDLNHVSEFTGTIARKYFYGTHGGKRFQYEFRNSLYIDKKYFLSELFFFTMRDFPEFFGVGDTINKAYEKLMLAIHLAVLNDELPVELEKELVKSRYD